MGKKRGIKNMSPSSIIDLVVRRKKKEQMKYTVVKPIKKLTEKEMKSSEKFIRDSWERD